MPVNKPNLSTPLSLRRGQGEVFLAQIKERMKKVKPGVIPGFATL